MGWLVMWRLSRHPMSDIPQITKGVGRQYASAMSDDSPRERYERARDQLSKAHDQESVEDADYYAITDFLDVKDPDDFVEQDDDVDEATPNTLYNYCTTLRTISQRSDTPLTELTTKELNALLKRFVKGRHDDVPEDGLSPSTVHAYSVALRTFYRYHDDLSVNPDNIKMPDKPDPAVDDTDMFTDDEVEAMRDNLGHPRDRALFETFYYTGQRARAIQTLRWKDIYLEESRYRLNPEVDGLKGADNVAKKRPLLGAEGPLRQWKQFHPDPDPENYVFCGKPEWPRTDPTEPLSQRSIRRILQDIADEAGVDKPVNPHNFRHNFVTMCIRDRDMDDKHVKRLIGHKAASRVMEETYQHLSDDDVNRTAESAFGYRDEDETNDFAPDVCTNCSSPLRGKGKACPDCGAVFSPDAQAAKDRFDTDDRESLKATDDPDAYDEADTFRQKVRENPELLLELYEDIADDDDPAGATPAVSDD